MEPTPEEREAVMLRFRHLNPHRAAEEPTADEFVDLLADIRERKTAIEAEALRLLNRGTRRPRRRRGCFTTSVLFAAAVLVLLGMLVTL